MARKHVLLAVALGSALLLLSIVFVLRHDRSRVNVSYADVTNGTITRQVMTTGTLEPAKTVDTGTQVSGTVLSVDADFNARVREGQIVARLDPSAYEAQIIQAGAALAEAQANAARLKLVADDARVKLERAQELAAQDLIAPVDLETAQLAAKQSLADLRAQEAVVRAANAMLSQAQVNRDHTIIRSPINGVVVNRSVEVGQTLAASVQSPVLFTIADLTRMHLLADINEADVGEVRPGTRVTFEVESVGRNQFEGTVGEVRLQPNVEPASTTGTTGTTTPQTTASASSRGATQTGSTGQTTPASPSSAPGSAQSPTTASRGGLGVVSFTAVIDVENADGSLSPGNTAIITLPVAKRTGAVRIPNNALSFRPSQDVFDALGEKSPILDQDEPAAKRAEGRLAHVWKYEDGRFVPVTVRTGLADDSWTELVSGDLRPGDRLVTNVALGR
jgi:HlyD family secretion protein